MKRSDFTLCLSLISLRLKNGFGHNQEFSAGRLIRQSAYACRYCIHLQLWASCLSPKQISFRDLGWQDFIARPDSCQTNFCAGKCLYPLNTYHNTTKHSYIQSIVNHYNPEVPGVQITLFSPCTYQEVLMAHIKCYQNNRTKMPTRSRQGGDVALKRDTIPNKPIAKAKVDHHHTHKV